MSTALDFRTLLALRAPDGATVTLERYPILLGRSLPGGVIPDVDVSHLDPTEAVDNRHCELTRDEQGLEVRDLGGVSGTWVDGRRLAPGGRALLEVGGTLRVAGVEMQLVEAGARALPHPSSRPAPPEWPLGHSLQSVPLPPSAGLGEEPDEAAAPEPWTGVDGLDLTGAPVLARPPLARGAQRVRLRPGAALRALHGAAWEQEGGPVSEAAAADALATVRRALGLADDAPSGQGQVGDVALAFVAPPLAGPVLELTVNPRRPADLDPSSLQATCSELAQGGALLVAAEDPSPALAALSRGLDPLVGGVRVLAPGEDPWWLPDGWTRLDGAHPAAILAALTAELLVLDRPAAAELEALLSGLPRPAGGTVLALSCASVAAAVEQLAQRLPSLPGLTPEQRRREVCWRVPAALTCSRRMWAFAPTAEAAGVV